MTDYTPDDIRLAFAESFTLHTMEEPGLTQAYEVFDRFINEIKADAWGEGQEAGWDDAQQQWSFTGMVGDFYKHSSTPTPYRTTKEETT